VYATLQRVQVAAQVGLPSGTNNQPIQHWGVPCI
jgi:hypothetical protein